jgi:hypothetical protein
MSSTPAQRILFFYCYRCREYELKTSPHYRSLKRKIARRKAAKARKAAAQAQQQEGRA